LDCFDCLVCYVDVLIHVLVSECLF
jgi:hypothetical protein